MKIVRILYGFIFLVCAIVFMCYMPLVTHPESFHPYMIPPTVITIALTILILYLFHLLDSYQYYASLGKYLFLTAFLKSAPPYSSLTIENIDEHITEAVKKDDFETVIKLQEIKDNLLKTQNNKKKEND